jgi:hypothetical protein
MWSLLFYPNVFSIYSQYVASQRHNEQSTLNRPYCPIFGLVNSLNKLDLTQICILTISCFPS